MKKFGVCLSILGSIFLFLHSPIAFAQTIGITGTIATIETGWTGEGIYIVLNPSPNTNTATNNPACSDTRIFMPANAPQYKDNLAILLAARSLNADVLIYYSTTCNSTWKTYAFVGVNY